MFWQLFIWNRVTAKQRNIALTVTLIIFIGSFVFIFKSSSENYTLDYIFTFCDAYMFFNSFLFFTVFREHFREGRLHWYQYRNFWFGILYCALLLMGTIMIIYDNRLITLLTMLALLFLCGIVVFISYIFLILTLKQRKKIEPKN